MGNAGVHNFAPVRDDERKELNLSKKLNYRQYCRHVEGRPDESCLKELPWNLCESLSLYERMNASFNRIQAIPDELPLRLPHLSHLDLSHNNLITLPDNIGLLFHLESLLLRFNKIKMLPDSLFHLIKLNKLDLSHNSIKIIQNKFLHLESLEKLDLSNNKLKALPSSLGGLKTLKVLIAHDNRLFEQQDAACQCGSDELLSHLRKNYNLSGGQTSGNPGLANQNVFPRVRGNHLPTSVPNPHSAQVQYIQSQTHTAHTSSRVKTPLLPPPGGSKLEAYMLRDKILGLIYGAAIGDALGLATCCMTADQCHFHYSSDNIHYSDIVKDEVRVRWKTGDWTSNFDTMVLLLDSIIAWAGVLDELEYARRLHYWCQHGYTELGDKTGIILSETVKEIVEMPEFLKNPHSAAKDVLNKCGVHVYSVKRRATTNHNHADAESCSLDSGSSDSSLGDDDGQQEIIFPSSYPCIPAHTFGTDNGALVSIPILGIPYFHQLEEVELNTVRICKTTHSQPLCVASSVLVTSLVSQILQGGHDLNCHKSVEEMISRAVTLATKHITDGDQLEEFNRHVSLTNINSVNIGEKYNMSYSLKAATAGLLALRSQQSYKSFMMSVFNEGGDSNSNGCVAGALLGCKLGYSKLPPDWLEGLRKKKTNWLNVKINHLLDMIGLP